MLGRYAKGLTAGDDEVVWSQMLDYWVATGQLSADQISASSAGGLTEEGFRELGFMASWGQAPSSDPQSGTSDGWWTSPGDAAWSVADSDGADAVAGSWW